MSTVTIRTGTEGPKYDPYSYEEITVHRQGVKVKRHIGLGDWLEINDRKVLIQTDPEMNYNERVDHWYETLDELFERHAGVSSKVAKRAYDQFQARQIPTCLNGSRKHGQTKSMDGYPGESFEVCIRCGHIVESFFDEGAII